MRTDPAAAPVHDDDIIYPTAIPFVLIHIAAFAAIWTGVSAEALALCGALYVLRMFAVTGGYHRYFSHRSFATGRVFQFVLAFLAQSTAQKSVLWWAAKHRHHHRYSDMVEDVHSPRHTGFVYSHLGWIFARRHDVADLSTVPDLTRFPELRWLHRHENVPALALGVACFLLGGWQGLIVGFVWSTLLVYHGTFCINSLAHVRGHKRYVTGDDSRNNWLLAIVTMGEGWHNNHHAFPASTRQGFRWWEVDVTFYILKGLAFVRVVGDLKAPPARVVRNEHHLGARIVDRTAAQLAARFHPAPIAEALRASLPDRDVVALGDDLHRAAPPPGDCWSLFHPILPSREALLAEARTLFARTPSMDDIVDRAHRLVLIAIGRQLAQTTA